MHNPSRVILSQLSWAIFVPYLWRLDGCEPHDVTMNVCSLVVASHDASLNSPCEKHPDLPVTMQGRRWFWGQRFSLKWYSKSSTLSSTSKVISISIFQERQWSLQFMIAFCILFLKKPRLSRERLMFLVLWMTLNRRIFLPKSNVTTRSLFGFFEKSWEQCFKDLL